MKIVKFNNKEYVCPQCWDEVTLKQVIDTQELQDVLEDSPIVAIIAGYTGIPVEELQVSRVPELQEILNTLEFIYEEYVPVPQYEFSYQGQLYGTNPSIEETEFQEWVSIQTCLYNSRENPVRGLPRLIAIMCKLENETLDVVDINARALLFMGLPITTVRNLESFFLSSQVALRSSILLSSTIPEQEKLLLHKFKELDSMMIKRSQELGWYSPTRFVIGIYRLYLKYLKQGLEKSFSSEPIKS